MRNLGFVATLVLGLLLIAGCSSQSTATTVAPTSSPGVPVPADTEPVPAPSTTAGAELAEIDLETNITVFFDPARIEDQAQAEQALREIIGDDAVDATVVVGRLDAWAIATDLAGRAPNPVDLDPDWQQSIGEVARVVVSDRDVRNQLTDGFEDSPDVAAVAYVVGVRVAAPGVTELQPVWELLGYLWSAE